MKLRVEEKISPNLVVAAAGAFLVFGALGIASRRGSLRGADRAVRRKVHPKKNRRLSKIARAVSSVAAPHVHPLAAAALALTVGSRRGRGAPSVFLASVLATGLDKASRLAVHQKRPPGAHKHKGLDKYAYPSGHTCAVTAIGVAAASEISEIASPKLERIIWLSVLASAAAVGWSRLYLDEHWIDDVIGGWGACLAVGVASVALADKVDPGKIETRLSAWV